MEVVRVRIFIIWLVPTMIFCRLAQSAWARIIRKACLAHHMCLFAVAIQIGCAAVAPKMAPMKQLNKIVISVTRYAAPRTNPAAPTCPASVDGLPNVAKRVCACIESKGDGFVSLCLETRLLVNKVLGSEPLVFIQMRRRSLGIRQRRHRGRRRARRGHRGVEVREVTRVATWPLGLPSPLGFPIDVVKVVSLCKFSCGTVCRMGVEQDRSA